MHRRHVEDLPPELRAGMAEEPRREKVYRKSTRSRLPAPVAQPKAPGKEVATRNKPPLQPMDWRNYLRPRYLQHKDGRIKVLPKQLAHEFASTLAASGGPFFANAFTLPLSRYQLQDAEYWPEGRKRGYRIDADTQWDMFKLFLKTAPEPGLYIVSTDVLTPQLRQIVYTMLMHTVYALECKHVKWIGLYSTHRDQLRDDKPILDALVVGNVHEGMDPTKYSKLRDILHIYSAIPIFLIVDGVDCLEFSMRYLHEIPKLVMRIGEARQPKYLHTV